MKVSSDEIDDGEPDSPTVVLENKGLWDAFAAIGTEMVITKTGRLVVHNIISDEYIIANWITEDISLICSI